MEKPNKSKNRSTVMDFLNEFIPEGEEMNLIEKWESSGDFWTPASNLDTLYNHREKKYKWDFERDSESPEGVQDEKGYRLAWLIKEIRGYESGLKEGKWGRSSSVIKKYIQKRKSEKSGKPDLKFEDLFAMKDHAKRLDLYFENNGFITNGKFTGKSGNKTELAAVFWVLRDWNIIISGKDETQLRAFYRHYGLEIGTGKDVSVKSVRDTPSTKDYNEYQHWLKDLFN